MEQGSLKKAEAALLELNASYVSPKDESGRMAWLGYTRWIIGDIPAAERSYRDGVLVAERTGSRDIICEALFQLEKFLLWTGPPLEYETVRAGRLQTVQSTGSIVCFDMDDSRPGASRNPRDSPSVINIHIASSASCEKWRQSAFTELAGGPGALLKIDNILHGTHGVHATAVSDQLRTTRLNANSARRNSPEE